MVEGDAMWAVGLDVVISGNTRFRHWEFGKKSSSNDAQFYASPPRSCKTDSQTTQQKSCESANNNSIVNRVLCIKQCMKYAGHLKKATREMERSSKGVRDDANIDLSTVGVTGILLCESGDTGEMPRVLLVTGDDMLTLAWSAADHAAPSAGRRCKDFVRIKGPSGMTDPSFEHNSLSTGHITDLLKNQSAKGSCRNCLTRTKTVTSILLTRSTH